MMDGSRKRQVSTFRPSKKNTKLQQRATEDASANGLIVDGANFLMISL